MIKKHLITCTVMLVLLIAANVYRTTAPTSFDKFLTLAIEPEKPAVTTDDYLSTLSFAEEIIPVEDRRVQTKMYRTLRAHSHHSLQTSQLHQHAAKWFPIIEPILEKYGIPEDFKYMPLVESGLKGGTSPKGASGYWQFMPQTARGYGLRVDPDVDERQNMYKSTVAAAKYLRSLYKEFNSWTLAAAAYNVGEGSLKRQINKQGQQNYYKLKLNRETAGYVYKLVSMKEIIENPTRHGYHSRISRLLAREKTLVTHNFPYDEHAIKSFVGTPEILNN